LSLSLGFVSSVFLSNFALQITHQTINQMPKIKLFQGDQLPIDELLPEAPTVLYKPIRKALKKEPLYRVMRPTS
jgi:hypothetical protein